MWFSFFAAILILAITFYQGLHGLFSAMIMCLLTVLSAALAFGLHDAVYYDYLLESQPEMGRAIAFLGIFLVSLVVLRVLADALITKSMHFHPIAEKIGGGVFGFISAMVIVGSLAIGIQMLPFGRSLLGFERYELVDASGKSIYDTGKDESGREKAFNTKDPIDWSKIQVKRNNIWLNPDGFTVGVVNLLSSNALAPGSGMDLEEAHPNFLDELFFLRTHPLGQKKIVAPPNGISVEQVWNFGESKRGLYTRTLEEQQKEIKLTPDKTQPTPGRMWLGIRVKFNASAADESGQYRFTPEQVALVEQGGEARFHPMAISDPMLKSKIVRVREIEPYVLKTAANEKEGVAATEPVVDFVFDVPDNFKPGFLQYKFTARAPVSLPGEDAKTPAPLKDAYTGQPSGNTTSPQPTPTPTPTPSPAPRPPTPDTDDGDNNGGSSDTTTGNPDRPMNPRGRVHNFNIGSTDPLFTNLLPFELTDYSSIRALETSGNVIEGGHLIAKLNENWQPEPGNKAMIDALEEPEGQRVLQLYTDSLQARSVLGNALAFARRNVQNIYIVDDTGAMHMPSGRWAAAKVGRQNYFELFYLNDLERGMARIPPFSRIKDRNLDPPGSYSYVFIFHVPVGRKVMKFHTGQADIDLASFNLVATRE